MSTERFSDKSTLATKITDSLRQEIIRGDLAPGTKLSEPQLSTRFDVSRGPIREAIRRLEVEGLVRHVPHEGVRVITLNSEEMSQISELREALEGQAAGLAAQRMSDPEIAALRSLWDQHREHHLACGEYPQTESDSDMDFHFRIVQGCKNPVLIRNICDGCYQLIRMFRYRSSRLQHRSALALREHEQIVFAIEQRDSQLAELVMRRHIARARRDIEQSMNPSQGG